MKLRRLGGRLKMLLPPNAIVTSIPHHASIDDIQCSQTRTVVLEQTGSISVGKTDDICAFDASWERRNWRHTDFGTGRARRVFQDGSRRVEGEAEGTGSGAMEDAPV